MVITKEELKSIIRECIEEETMTVEDTYNAFCNEMDNFGKLTDVLVNESAVILEVSGKEIVNKIKQLWEKFKAWVKKVVDKIKGLFTNSEKTAKETKEELKKIDVKSIDKDEVKDIKFWKIKDYENDKFTNAMNALGSINNIAFRSSASIKDDGVHASTSNDSDAIARVEKVNNEIKETLKPVFSEIKDNENDIIIYRTFFEDITNANYIVDNIMKYQNIVDKAMKEANNKINDLQKIIDSINTTKLQDGDVNLDDRTINARVAADIRYDIANLQNFYNAASRMATYCVKCGNSLKKAVEQTSKFCGPKEA